MALYSCIVVGIAVGISVGDTVVGLFVLYSSLQAVNPVYQHAVPAGQSVDIVVGQDCKHISEASVIVRPHQNVSFDFITATAVTAGEGCNKSNSCSSNNSISGSI
jgi:hypothetical protein